MLKSKLQRKNLNNITIKDIVDACDLNRQTFYYHFDDIYDLARYMLENDLKQFIEKTSQKENLIDFLYYLSENRQMLLHIITPLEKSFLRKSLAKYENTILKKLLGDAYDLSPLNEKEKKFLYHYVMVSFEAIVESWVYEEIELTPEEFMRTMEKIHFAMEERKNDKEETI